MCIRMTSTSLGNALLSHATHKRRIRTGFSFRNLPRRPATSPKRPSLRTKAFCTSLRPVFLMFLLFYYIIVGFFLMFFLFFSLNTFQKKRQGWSRRLWRGFDEVNDELMYCCYWVVFIFHLIWVLTQQHEILLDWLFCLLQYHLCMISGKQR